MRLSMLIFASVCGVNCSHLPENTDRPVTHAIAMKASTSKSGFLPLSNGLDAFAARAALAEGATKTIDAQYYILHDDVVGRSFAYLLSEAADRGVRVRLLLDDMFLGGAYDLGLTYLDQHPNIEVRSFNPFSRATTRIKQYLSRFGAVTRRMHNKSFTADNKATILGGRNIGNEYFAADSREDFGDLDVLSVGPVVNDVSRSFDDYWNHPQAYPIASLSKRKASAAEAKEARQALDRLIAEQQDSDYVKRLRNSPFAKAYLHGQLDYYWGDAKVVVDSPDKLVKSRSRTDLHLERELFAEFARAQSEVIIISPYFIPGKSGTDGLVALAKKGVKVRVLTNGLASNNHTVVHGHYAKYRKQLLEAGIELHEAKAHAKRDGKHRVLHAKAFVVDRKAVFVGSLNFDPRSVTENTEIGVVVNSNDFGKAMGDWFDHNIDQVAYRLKLSPDQRRLVWHTPSGTLQVEPESNRWQRFKMRLFGMLPIESQL